MYKCIKQFFTTGMVKYYYGMRISTFDYKSLTQTEKKNFIAEEDYFIHVPELEKDIKEMNEVLKKMP